MRALIPFFLAFGLVGCQTGVETRIANSGVGIKTPQNFSLAEAPGPKNPLTMQAQSAVVSELIRQGHQQTDAAPVQLIVTFAELPAKLVLKNGAGQALSEAPRKRIFAPCAKNEYRMGVTMINIADGAILYQGSAAEFHCKAGAEAVLSTLVKDALKDLEQPKGRYVTKRNGAQ